MSFVFLNDVAKLQNKSKKRISFRKIFGGLENFAYLCKVFNVYAEYDKIKIYHHHDNDYVRCGGLCTENHAGLL